MKSSLFDDDDEPAAPPSNAVPELSGISTLMWFKGKSGLGWYARSRASDVFHYHPTDPLEACRKATEKRTRRRIIL